MAESDSEDSELADLELENPNQFLDKSYEFESFSETSEEESAMPELLEDEEFEEEKDCWICFVRESENRQATWVTPCKCAGSMGHVHQDCIKRWVEEKQSGNINEEVLCPQCNTKYAFVFPEKNVFLQLLNISNELTKCGVQLVIIGSFVGVVYMSFTFYTRNVLRVMFSNEATDALLYKSGECLTLEPYYEGAFLPTLRNFLQRNRLDANSVSLIMGLDSLHFALATPEFWRARQLTLPFIRAATSITVPFYLLQFRNFAWDEWILKKIDQYQNVSSKYREVSGSSRSRSVVGGLAMPFIANAVGRVLYSNYTPFKRWLLGCCTYLVVKGGVTLVRKYKLRRWTRARQVKDYEETDDNEEENRGGFSIELNGENVIGPIRW